LKGRIIRAAITVGLSAALVAAVAFVGGSAAPPAQAADQSGQSRRHGRLPRRASATSAVTCVTSARQLDPERGRPEPKSPVDVLPGSPRTDRALQTAPATGTATTRRFQLRRPRLCAFRRRLAAGPERRRRAETTTSRLFQHIDRVLRQDHGRAPSRVHVRQSLLAGVHGHPVRQLEPG